MVEIKRTSKSGTEYRIINDLPYPQCGNPGSGCFTIEWKKIYKHDNGEEMVCWMYDGWPEKPSPKIYTEFADVLNRFDELIAS